MDSNMSSYAGESEALPVPLRDSVVAGPSRANKSLVEEWSFVDEDALMSASGGADGPSSNKKGSRRSKKDKSESRR
jgi:hypothetical protein